jgi:enterobactin synthetase component D / holo-[acyl-carrier protein] synthase
MSRQLFGLFDDSRVHVLTSAVRDAAIASLSKKEAAALDNVADKRKREFATARALAREGLESFFNVHSFDLLNAEDRSPIWPQGIEGSISHSDTRAWVALVDASFGTIGIDGEARDELKPELWHLTLLDEEIAYLQTLDASVRSRIALTMFSAKEALYKAQYPRSGSMMSLMSVRVGFDAPGSLCCTFREAVGPFPNGFVVRGRWLEEEELVTAVWIPDDRALPLDLKRARNHEILCRTSNASVEIP